MLRIHYAIIVALLHAFAATQSRNLCPNDMDQAIDSSVSSYCRANVQNYSRLLVDKASGRIAVAAKANLMVLPLDLDKAKAINFTKLATRLEKTLCQLDFSDPEKCENYFRVLLKDRQSPNIFVCSTNANNPKCAYYNITDLSVVDSNWASSSYPVCPGDPSASNTALMTINAGNNIDVVVGSEKDGKYLVGKYRPPSFQIHSPLSDVNYLNSPDVKFISSHEVGEHVFLFLRETALEAWSQYTYSRVVRVCKDDLGDSTFVRYNWKTFLKARISCTVSAGSPAYHYDRLVATSYIKNAVYTPTATVQDVVYAVFTGSPGSPSGSAVCVFGFNGTYQGDFSQAYGRDYWVTNSDGLWLTDTKKQFTCSTPKSSANEFNYNLVSTDVQQATSGRPLATINGATATSLAVDRVKTPDGVDYDVLFVGFDDGSVRKIVQVRDGVSWKEKIVETIVVDVDNAVIQLELLDDANPSQRKVYALTEKKVASLSVERCDRLNTCKECIEAQDPYCGWSSSLSSCLALGSGVVEQDVRAGNYTRFCPKAPADYLVSVDYLKSTSYSLFFSWTPISVPPSPYSIPSFRLYQDGVNIANVSSSVTSYNLTSLLPYTEYTFSILPINNFGEGEESNIVSATTHIAAPDSVLLRGSSQQPKEIALAWEKPLITNGPLSKYKVYSAESGQSLTLASTLSHPHIIRKRLNYTDTSLKPETTYVYQVESCTEDSNGEFCSKSNSISVETPCDYPSAPRNVIASALNSSSIRLQWNAPSTPNGRLLGYRIRKEPRGEYVSSSTTSIVVSDLISFTNYTFTVAALTCVGYGPSSLATASRTLPAAPPKSETPRLVPSTSDRTIAVNWTPPSRVEGSIQNFILCRSPGSCLTFSSSTVSYIDANVSPCVEYEYTIAVRSDGGDGEASDVTSAFIIGYSNNVTTVQSSVQSSSEIAITWDAPSPRNGLCHVDYYSILQNGIQVSNASFTSYFASGLSSATSYVFRVASATAAGVGTYAEIRATTLPSRPAQPTSLNSKIISGNKIQLTWAEPNPNYGNPTNYHVYELFGGNRQTVSGATTSFDIPSDWIPVAGQTYSFYVTAENGAGEGSAAKVDVDVSEKIPGKPAGIYAMATGKTTARVAWLPPAWNELNGQISGYKIERVKPAPIQLVKEVPGMATTSLDVTSLTAGTVYAFRVSAKNGAGYGATITSVDMETEKDLPTPVPPTCRPTIITVNPPSVPTVPSSTLAPGPATTKPPLQGVSASIAATAVSSLEMSVTWTINKPENNVQRIVINRRQETAGLTWTSYAEKCCNGNFQLSFRDNTLSPYTKYQYSLDVFMNDGSIHKNLASDQARTHSAAPAAPKNLRFSAVTMTTVTLTWDVPQPENGIVSEYDVTLDSFSNMTTTKQRTAIIRNLKPYTIYGFRVRAITTSQDGNRLNGEFSLRYEVRTATAPPEKLPAPIVVAASTTSVFLSWSQPTILTGIVTGYRFYWHEKTGAACPSSRENDVGPSRDIESRRQLNDVVTDLKVDTGYCFAVVAKTSAGYGTLSDYASVTTFSLASLGENVSCPNIDLLRNYIDQLILTPAPPPTTSRKPTSTLGTVIVEELTSSSDGKTIVIIVGVVAGLAVITTLVLGILLVIYCHRGGFSVSDFVGDSDGGGGGANDVDGQTSKKNLLNGDAQWARRVSTETGPVGAPVAPRTLPPLKGAPRAPSGLYEPVMTRTTSKLATSGSKSAEADKAEGLDQTSM